MEAMHYRYHPLTQRLAELVAELGPVQHLQCWTSFAIVSPGDIRYDFDLGGGALMDGGCYALDCLRLLGASDGQSAPSVTGALADPVVPDPRGAAVGPVNGRPAGLPWRGDGLVRLHVHQGRRVPGRRARHLPGRAGTAGQLHLPAQGPAGGDQGRAVVADEQGDGDSTYVYQLRAFAVAIAGGEPVPTSAAHAVTTMRLIDDAYRAAGLLPRPWDRRG